MQPLRPKFIQFLGHAPKGVFYPLKQGYNWLHGLQHRQRQALLAEITAVEGLMPLLMKQRNGHHWTEEDKLQLREHMRHLARLSPYVLAIVMPGGFIALPLMAWWLDRRRLRRGPPAPPDSTPRA